MEIMRLTYQEYWGYYWRITSRHKIPGIFEWDRNLVNLIEQQCQLKPGDSIIDLGCGGGDQANVFAKKGYKIVGIDLVQSLLDYANNVFKKDGLCGEFYVGDMRNIKYQNEFDLCVILSGTFGFFNDFENEQLLKTIHRALKNGGHLVLDYLPLEIYSKISNTKNWKVIEDGFALSEEWFDNPSSTYRSKHMHILLNGQIFEPAEEPGYHANEIIRCYGTREIESLADNVGFSIIAHLTRKHVNNPDYKPEANEPRGMLFLRKRL